MKSRFFVSLFRAWKCAGILLLVCAVTSGCASTGRDAEGGAQLVFNAYGFTSAADMEHYRSLAIGYSQQHYASQYLYFFDPESGEVSAYSIPYSTVLMNYRLQGKAEPGISFQTSLTSLIPETFFCSISECGVPFSMMRSGNGNSVTDSVYHFLGTFSAPQGEDGVVYLRYAAREDELVIELVRVVGWSLWKESSRRESVLHVFPAGFDFYDFEYAISPSGGVAWRARNRYEDRLIHIIPADSEDEIVLPKSEQSQTAMEWLDDDVLLYFALQEKENNVLDRQILMKYSVQSNKSVPCLTSKGDPIVDNCGGSNIAIEPSGTRIAYFVFGIEEDEWSASMLYAIRIVDMETGDTWLYDLFEGTGNHYDKEWTTTKNGIVMKAPDNFISARIYWYE